MTFVQELHTAREEYEGHVQLPVSHTGIVYVVVELSAEPQKASKKEFSAVVPNTAGHASAMAPRILSWNTPTSCQVWLPRFRTSHENNLDIVCCAEWKQSRMRSNEMDTRVSAITPVL